MHLNKDVDELLDLSLKNKVLSPVAMTEVSPILAHL